MKVELLGGQHDGKVMDVAEPPADHLVLPDLASYGEPMFNPDAETPATTSFRTLTYVRQYRGTAYTKKVVYVYDQSRG